MVPINEQTLLQQTGVFTFHAEVEDLEDFQKRLKEFIDLRKYIPEAISGGFG